MSTVSTAVIRADELIASPWKNGGGVTREIAAHIPALRSDRASLDAFVWRVSVADVASAGPFSQFDGVDRTLVLLSGAGMLLDESTGQGDRTHALTQPLDVARFRGEAAIDARLVDGATRDFNLMVRRHAATGTLDVWRGATRRTLNADVALLYCATGVVTVTVGDATPVHLAAGDTLRIDRAHDVRCNVEGNEANDASALLAVEIRYT
ncbi:HutD/Ves family protein [Paraburkholderia sp.]|uniref:HutD/Ves family protein n=1 Tax=Paraburkholderia sp. TaxID=1926495 RepID=UPI003D6F60C6